MAHRWTPKDIKAAAVARVVVHLRNDDEGILQLEAESPPSDAKGGMDFGAATMLMQQIEMDTALRSLFLLSRLLKDGGPIIVVDARPLGREGTEWTNGSGLPVRGNRGMSQY